MANETARNENCVALLQKTFDRLMELTEGQVTSIGFSDRNVSYQYPGYKELMQQYNALHARCGCDTGLPKLSAPRGRPFAITFR